MKYDGVFAKSFTLTMTKKNLLVMIGGGGQYYMYYMNKSGLRTI